MNPDAGGSAGGSSGGGAAVDAGPAPGQLGSVCTNAVSCASGHCVDGVCCDTACEGVCGSCLGGKTGGVNGTCAAITAGTDPDDECGVPPGSCQTGACGGARACARVADGDICRPATGPCDLPERCDVDTCPADAFAPPTQDCRPAAGACDVAERCNGTNAQCPPDALQAAASSCRASAGACDPAETCDGVTPACPADTRAPAQTECRAAAGPCDVAETCDGTSPTCPTDALAPAALVCRPAAGVCDVAESCTGASAACPTDRFEPAVRLCRMAVGPCDTPDFCPGGAANCTPDAKFNGGVCRGAGGPCDPAERCDGVSDACPADMREPATSEVCSPYRCTGTSQTCTSGTCANDAACSIGAFCRGGVCVRGKRVFVTSTSTTGNIGGLAGADAICAARATAAVIPGTFRAWLSTATVSAASRFTQATVPYYRRAGGNIVLLAQNWAALTANSNTVPGQIAFDENGVFVSANVWTGTSTTGTSAVPTCVDWTSVSGPSGGRQGVSAPQPQDIGWWTNQGTTACSQANRLYCFEQ
jgi:hypothetical protein